MEGPLRLVESVPIVALRYWTWQSDQARVLSAVMVSPDGDRYDWPLSPVAARCARLDQWIGPRHDAPYDLCTCGWYGVAPSRVTAVHVTSGSLRCATYEADGVHVYHSESDVCHRDYTAGFAALWGRVVVGDNGVYRAQYAYPIAFFAGLAAPELARAYGAVVLPVPSSPGELVEAARACADRLVGAASRTPCG